MNQQIPVLVEKCSDCFHTCNLAIFDPTTGKPIASVALPEFPHEFTTDAGNRLADVGNDGVELAGITGPGGHTIFQIDIRASQLVWSIDLSAVPESNTRPSGAGDLDVM